MRPDGKTARITGAARGIGLAFAQAYLRESARVAIADIDPDQAKAAAALNLIHHGINVNAIALGVVDGEHRDGPVGSHGPLAAAEDLTGVAIFPAGDEANDIVAQCYNVDGGQWMS